MIRITVELVSAVHPSRNRVLGIAEIENDGQASLLTDGAQGDYLVKLSKWAPKLSETWKRARVERFDRVGRGAWDLLYLALHACVGDRNRPAPARSAPRRSRAY